MNHRTLFRWLAALWTLGIVVALSLPPANIPGPSELLAYDKAAHVLLFIGFGALWMAALSHPLPRRALMVLFAGIAFAIGSEVYQGLLPFPRTPDPLDALADVVGLLGGIGLAYALLRHFARARRPEALSEGQSA